MSEAPPLRARSRAEIDAASFTVGRQTVVPLNDGEFLMDREFLNNPTPHDELADADGNVRLPIGCFLIPGDRPILVDAGFGDRIAPPVLRGGLLLLELENIGLSPEDIAILAISHLHRDHRGWIADPEGEAVFSNAELVVARADLDHFLVDQMRPLEEHERAGIDQHSDAGKLRLLDGETEVAPGIVAMPAPGHTPGHTVYAIVDGPERALLLGDSMYCPQQLDELDWGAVVDVDPVLARRTRATLLADLEAHGGGAVGCHFPNLRASRVLTQ
jgi:glyoxylase-like metal-dependent hydrolase (beta-lactamase superfamily II)